MPFLISVLSVLFVASGTNDPGATFSRMDRIAPCELPSAAGGERLLASERATLAGTALYFFAPDCETSRGELDVLAELAEGYQPEGFAFFAVNSHPQPLAAENERIAEAVGVEVLLDPMQKLMGRLGVTRSAELAVLDRSNRLIYRGPLLVEGQNRLGEILEMLIMEERVDFPFSAGAGAPLPDIWKPAATTTVRYAEHVAAIVNEHCVSCHRPGQIGPMSFLSYEETAPWAAMIAEVVADERMPPWSASPEYGDFHNERRLSEEQKAQLILWAQGGAPAGDLTKAPLAPEVQDEEWEIGTPDRVFEVPETQEIPAEGVIPYRYLMLDPGFEQDAWIQAVEVKPGNRAVTHHVIVFLLPPGVTPSQFFRDPQGPLSTGLFAGYAPGTRAEIFPEGTAKLVTAGTRFLFELHYSPTGTPETDLTRVGVRFSPSANNRVVKTLGIVNYRFRIAPHDPAAVFEASHMFRRPIELLSLNPHMHSRGKSFAFDLERDEGSERLLSVPAYDFNWQHTYELRQPLHLDAGDVLKITAVYDNSADNPSNPDPAATVTWGEQTFEEMMIGFLTYLDAE